MLLLYNALIIDSEWCSITPIFACGILFFSFEKFNYEMHFNNN